MLSLVRFNFNQLLNIINISSLSHFRNLEIDKNLDQELCELLGSIQELNIGDYSLLVSASYLDIPLKYRIFQLYICRRLTLYGFLVASYIMHFVVTDQQLTFQTLVYGIL